MSSAVAVLHREQILAKVAKGELLKNVAAEFGITHAAISQKLSKDPEYRQAREIGVEARLEQQYGAMDAAEDALTLARARESFRAASWFAEREFPARWGNKTQLSGTDGQPLQINNIAITFVQAAPSCSATIEHDAQDVVDTNLD